MNYPSKELVKNISPVPRTLSQANRDAEYSSAITVFKAEVKLVFGFFIEALIGFMVTLAIVSPFAVGFWLWVNR